MNIPTLYQKSFSAYRDKVLKLSIWKDGQGDRLMCPTSYVAPNNNYDVYHKSYYSKQIKNQYNPPLDVLAKRFVSILGCESFPGSTAMWYVGERINRGEFSLEEWQASLSAALDKQETNKISSSDKATILSESNNILSSFKSDISSQVPLEFPYVNPSNSQLVDNYTSIRNKEIKFIGWLGLNGIGSRKKLPCDVDVNFEKNSFFEKVSHGADQKREGKITPETFCGTQKDALEKKYKLERGLKKIKEDLSELFKSAEIPDGTMQTGPYSMRGDLEEIVQQYTNKLSSFTGNFDARIPQMTDEHFEKHKDSLGAAVFKRKGETDDRLVKMLLENHMNEFSLFWTNEVILKNKNPKDPEVNRMVDNFLAQLNKKETHQLVLSCLESDGAVYAVSTHGNLKNTTSEFPEENDLGRWKTILSNRKAKEALNPNGDDHIFDEQTNAGSTQTSFNQVSESAPYSGKFYYRSIQNILRATRGADGKYIYNVDLAKQIIKSKCALRRLQSLAGRTKEAVDVAVDNIVDDLLPRFERSLNGYRFKFFPPWTATTEESQALEDYIMIQQFCSPLHLALSDQVYLNNPTQFGSLTNDARIKKCASLGEVVKIEKGINKKTKEMEYVGRITSTSHPALDDLNKKLKKEFLDNYLKTKEQVDQATQLATTDDKQTGSKKDKTLSELRSDYHRLSADIDRRAKEEKLLEKTKESPEVKNFFSEFKSAKFHEAWKLLAFDGYLKGWAGPDWTSDTSAHMKAALKAYIDAPESERESSRKAFEEAQHERTMASIRNFKNWIYQTKNDFDYIDKQYNPTSGDRFSSSMNGVVEQFEKLNILYSEYEGYLVDQLKICKRSFPNESGMEDAFPQYSNPVPKAIPVQLPDEKPKSISKPKKKTK